MFFSTNRKGWLLSALYSALCLAALAGAKSKDKERNGKQKGKLELFCWQHNHAHRKSQQVQNGKMLLALKKMNLLGSQDIKSTSKMEGWGLQLAVGSKAWFLAFMKTGLFISIITLKNCFSTMCQLSVSVLSALTDCVSGVAVPMIATSVKNTLQAFVLSLLPEQCGSTTIYTAFTSY